MNTSTGTFHQTVAATTNVGSGVAFSNAGTLLISQGTLSLQGGTTVSGSSELVFELSGPLAGTDYGLLQVSTALALNGQLFVELAPGFATGVGAMNTFTLVMAPTLTGAFTNVANGTRLMSLDGNGSFVVNYGVGSMFSPNAVVLSDFTPIPEPSTWILMLCGGAAGAWRLRRRA